MRERALKQVQTAEQAALMLGLYDPAGPVGAVTNGKRYNMEFMANPSARIIMQSWNYGARACHSQERIIHLMINNSSQCITGTHLTMGH